MALISDTPDELGLFDVLNVLVVADADGIDPETGQESEAVAAAFLASLGLAGTWVQTSYNGNLRGRMTGRGGKYDPINDRFLTPRPHPGWVPDANGEWVAPVAKPSEGHRWTEEFGGCWLDPAKAISAIDFLRRIPPAKQDIIEASPDSNVQGFAAELRSLHVVRLDSPRTIAASQYLATAGILTVEEVTALLADP